MHSSIMDTLFLHLNDGKLHNHVKNHSGSSQSLQRGHRANNQHKNRELNE